MNPRNALFSRNGRWAWAALFVGLAALLTISTQAQGQTPRAVTDDDVNRIASQMYCPVCQNVTLDVCATTACENWRADIRSRLEAGWSDQEIEDYFVNQYGARVTGTPPLEGFNWLLYAVLPLGVLGLGLAAYFVLRKRPARQQMNQKPDSTIRVRSDPWREKLNQDLKKDDPK